MKVLVKIWTSLVLLEACKLSVLVQACTSTSKKIVKILMLFTWYWTFLLHLLWRVPLNLGGWSCIALLSISLNLCLSSHWSFEQVRRISLFWHMILQFLGQPLAGAFGYWMVSWRMYGCGNPFKHFFAKYSHHLFATFLFWPRWMLCSYFRFLIIQTLWLLYLCIPSPTSCPQTHW